MKSKLSKGRTILSLLLVLFTVASCVKENDGINDGNDIIVDTAIVEVTPGYVYIDWENTILVTSDDSSGNYQMAFNGEVPTIVPGSIITIDRDTVVRHIFVKTVSVSGNVVTVTSKQAYLTDIFSDIDFTLSTSNNSKSSGRNRVFIPERAYVTDENGFCHEISLKSRTGKSTGFTHDLWHFVSNNDDVELLAGDNYSIYMERLNLDLDLDLEMYMNFGGRNVHEIIDNIIDRYQSQTLNVNASLVGNFNIEQMIRCDIHGECSYDQGCDLWKHNLFRPLTLRFVVSGVPIIIRLNADMYRQVELSANGEISAYTGFSDNAQGQVGFQWNQGGGMTPVAEISNTFQLEPPTVEGKGSVQGKVWAFPRIRVLLYDIVGPSFDIKPYLADTVRGGFKRQMLGRSNDYYAWSLDCSTGLDACCGLSLQFLGYEVENYSTPSWNMVNKRLYHSPKRIEHTSGRPSYGQTSTVNFTIYDQNYLLNREVVTPLSQIVKFEANGSLSSQYGIAENGVVSVNWTPSNNDVLYVKLYEASGQLIAWDSIHSKRGNEPTTYWVDLGLPSGLLWASRNIGANSPEDYGNYYAWGETTTKDHYGKDNYIFRNAVRNYWCLTKYCTDSYYGYNLFQDDLTQLEPADDAATVNIGGGAHMPSYNDVQELVTYTSKQYDTVNGVAGIRVTGSNGNSIFLPAAGYYSSDPKYVGQRLYYWTRSLCFQMPISAWFLNNHGSGFLPEGGERSYGHTVRPVCSPQKK